MKPYDIGDPCGGSGTVSGQSSELSIYFRDLTPGVTYKATITYARCEFAKVDGEYLIPSCSTGVPCVEGVDNSLITDEVVFEATDWGEILSKRCGQCDIEYLRCTMQDEADAWNTLHASDEGFVARTVSCSSGGFSVPAAAHHYTWFQSCNLEVVP